MGNPFSNTQFYSLEMFAVEGVVDKIIHRGDPGDYSCRGDEKSIRGDE